MALAAYRNLFRAARVAFEGDVRVLNAAKDQIRAGFRQTSSLSSADPEAHRALKHAEEVAVFLRSNVVQGRREGDTYRLRIHKDIERGDNNSVKMAGGATGFVSGQKCCQ